jgi:thiosulfate/3-mercaptopyruvate sulfurtransferase
MFRAFGHHKSSILDGGLPRWEAEGLPINRKPPAEAKTSQYPTPKFDKDTIRSEETLLKHNIKHLKPFN